MSTVTESPTFVGFEGTPYLITSDLFLRMVEQDLFPRDARVYLWDGILYEKMAKSLPHAAVHAAFSMAISRRVPAGYFVANENPVRLDDRHVPLPDLIVARGRPLDFYDTRYPDHRDVVIVVEIAVTSLAADLGPRRTRYALTLPDALYVVADVKNRRILTHAGARPDGTYADCVVTGPGESLRLAVDGVALDLIPYEDLLR